MAPQNGALPAPKGFSSAPPNPSEQELEAALSDSPVPVASKPLARHRIKDILRPEYPLERALQVLKTQPEARALFESQRHHDRLRLPSETKQFICVLRNPTNGNLVYLIGTTHATKASGNDVRMLIEAVLPDKVALEVGTSLNDPSDLVR